MPGVYGDFLGSFCELRDEYKVYNAVPKTAGGYDLSYAGTVTCIIQDGESGLNVRDSYSRKANSSGTGAGIVSVTSVKFMYSDSPIDLVNKFIEIDGCNYRPMDGSNWNKEGGFYITELHLVVGNDGEDSDVISLVRGTFG